MTSADEPASVVDIERDVAAFESAARLRRQRRRKAATVAGLAALGALAASALAPSLGGDDPTRGTIEGPARSAPPRSVPSPHAPAPRLEAEEP